MVLRKSNTRHFYRVLYGGELKSILILKRDDDQREGVVRAVKIFNCRRGQIHKTGEQIVGDMTSNHTTEWQIPVAELNRAGIAYLNSLDTIVESTDDARNPITPRYWRTESTTMIDVRLFENWVTFHCLRIDAPPVAVS